MSDLYTTSQNFRGVVRLHHLLSRRTMRRLRIGLGIATLGGGFLYGTAYLLFGSSHQYTLLVAGGSLLLAALLLEQCLLYCYSNFYFFQQIRSHIGRRAHTPDRCSFSVARIVLRDPDDLTRAFLESAAGRSVVHRAGGDPTAAATLLQQKDRPHLSARAITPTAAQPFSLLHLSEHLYQHDPALVQWLTAHGVMADEFLGAASWVVGRGWRTKRSQRFWSKDNLSALRGIGREWSYGRTWHLDRYARDLTTHTAFAKLTRSGPHDSTDVEALARSLVTDVAGNALIIGADGVGKLDLVAQLAQAMAHGKLLAAATGLKFVVLDSDQLFAEQQTRADLETAFLTILKETAAAGNIILVIEHLSRLITEGHAMNVPIAELLTPYLQSPQLQIIATDTPTTFHRTLEPNQSLTRHFTKITLDTTDLAHTVTLLERVAETAESTHNITITYPALVAIARAADRYLVSGVMPEKAVTLLLETVETVPSGETLTRSHVHAYVSDTTGVPVGPIQADEQSALLDLETILHERIVGQDTAIAAVAETIRRARAGVGETNRPIGSFLFLGPTGVGKTETAKVLAGAYFGSRESMLRFDMSEYSDEPALARLIGDADQAGTLSTQLRAHPYTLLLLDEFEKANGAIHDLFLQILDEGRFTDGTGATVNARNTIIIATSNAGSQRITELVNESTPDETLQQTVLEHLIETQQFKPELINRFDNTTVFHPLTIGQQSRVAELLLAELKSRLAERGFTLFLHPDVKEYLRREGYDETFGGRAMRRTIQNTVEAVIAKKIIAEGLEKGDHIEITAADLQNQTDTTSV